MRVIPPWSREESQRWVKAHPWLYGFYFGLLFGEMVGITYFLSGVASGAEAVAAGVFLGLVMWPLQALSTKSGWFERPDPDPSGKPIRRISDRGLRWFILVGGVAVISSAPSLLAGGVRAVVSAVSIGIVLPITFFHWRELRRRKREGG